MPTWEKRFDFIKKKTLMVFADKGIKYSQQSFADFLGTTKARVRSWEKGQHPHANDLAKISHKLHLSPEWLLLGTGQPEQTPQPDTGGRNGGTAPEPTLTSPAVGTMLEANLFSEDFLKAQARGDHSERLVKAIAMLSEIYTSKNEILIHAIESNLHAFSLSAHHGQEIRGLKKEIKEIKDNISGVKKSAA